MQGNPKVIAALNEALKEELTAINQYFLHAEMCENWHYDKLGDYIKKQSIDEMKHAEMLIERILFLDATCARPRLLQSCAVRGFLGWPPSLRIGNSENLSPQHPFKRVVRGIVSG